MHIWYEKAETTLIKEIDSMKNHLLLGFDNFKVRIQNWEFIY